MAKPTLDRISMGNFEKSEDGKILKNRGKASFNLFYDPHIAYNPYYINGKLTNGGIVSSRNISHTKRISKQEFLKKVNEDLIEIDCYLSEAKYSNGFPVFGSQSVQGILYKENEKKKSGDSFGEKK